MPAGKDQSVASKPSLRSKPRRSPKQRVEKLSGESPETFGVLFENNPISMWFYDRASLAFLEVNQAAVHRYGYSRLDFRKMTVEGLLPKAEVKALAPGGKRNPTALQRSGQVRHRLKNGGVIDVEVRSRALKFRGRDAVFVSADDVTAPTRAKKALAASEAELRALFASMTDVVLVIDRFGVYREIAPTKPGLLYQPPHELLGKNLRDVFPAEQARALLGTISQVLETRHTAQVEYELPIGGRLVWFACSISPMDDASTLWVARDVTDRKQAEVALQESEARYRAVAESANDAIVSSDRDGHIVSWNKAAETIFGYGAAEVLGRPVSLLMPAEYQDSFRAGMLRIVTSGQSEVSGKSTEGQGRRKDGTQFPLDMSLSAWHVRGQRFYTALVGDISERKQAQTLHEAVYRIAAAAETAGSLDDLYQDIHEIISSVMPAENFYITIYDETEDLLRFPYFKDLEDEPFIGGIQPGKGLTAFVLRTGKSLLCTQAVHDELERRGEVRLLGVPSAIWLGVPLIAAGKTIGAMVVQHYSDPQAYGVREQHMLEFVSAQVALAISRKRAEDELRRAKNALETTHLEVKRSLAREEILARTDGLTGLRNRFNFEELAAREFRVALRHRRALAITLFDADSLKEINDTLGHAAGDKALAYIARTALGHTRDTDVLARYGGDEFILLLPETTAQQALLVAERIRASVGAIPIGNGGRPIAVTLSIGIAELRGEPMDASVEQVVQRADKALYQAKAEGRNRTMVFDSGTADESSTREPVV